MQKNNYVQLFQMDWKFIVKIDNNCKEDQEPTKQNNVTLLICDGNVTNKPNTLMFILL